ncbi:MAG: TRAP transporter substrate-binding protein [Marinomonas foliarum]|uniref:TRAP transporter substrate-binding protein n=1 Tax=Marinomonas foliarum TaxID=491950 RepID=A0A369AC27_9GAMM|nr:TRAP transporter substrate-binding protein [Marinomonas foliarum]QRV22922.1 TRAP transporter substrate-binding protein [Marinomonas foliarum]RCX06912.1 TRAP-type C4-dicarboxylate transport system substrate-binding protein [Marinomonas foliarum]
MKKLFTLLTATAALSLAGCGDDSTKSDTIKLVAAHNQTNLSSPYQTGMLKLKEVADNSGFFDVEVHAGTIGTNENELVEKLVLGGADMVLVSPGFMTSSGIEEVDLFSLLYLFNDYSHWEKVVDGKVGKDIADIIYTKSGEKYRVAAYWTAGVRHWYGKQPVNSFADVKGMKIRTQTSGVVSQYWKEIGAVPTSVAWAELYQALSSNVVDAAENAYPYFIPMEHHKTSNGKYISETGHDYTTRLLLVRNSVWESFNDEQRTAFNQAVKEATQAERQALYSEESTYKQKAIDDGAIVNTLDRTPFIEKALSIQDQWAEKNGMTEVLETIRQTK